MRSPLRVLSVVAAFLGVFTGQPIAALVPCTTSADVSAIMVPQGFDCEIFAGNLDDPTGVAVEATGDVLVTQSGGNVNPNRVLRFSPEGVLLSTSSLIVDPDGVDVDGQGDVLVAGGSQVTIANSLDGGLDQVCRSGFSNLQDVAVNSQGRIVVIDFGGSILDVVCSTSTTLCHSIGSIGLSVAFDKDDRLFATRFAAGGGLFRIDQCGSATPIAALSGARRIAFGPGGPFGEKAFVSDETAGSSPDRIVEVDEIDGAVTEFATGFVVPAGIAFHGQSALYVADSGTDRMIKIFPLNGPPDCGGAVAAPNLLWPPDHVLWDISVLGVTDPDGDPVTITATSVSQDEAVAETGIGSGNTSPDASLSPLAVRAERNGNPKTPGNGRVYHVSFTADDSQGGTCNGTVSVCVPFAQRPGATCQDDGPLYNSIP